MEKRIPDKVVESAIRTLERLGDQGGMLPLLLDLRDARARVRELEAGKQPEKGGGK